MKAGQSSNTGNQENPHRDFMDEAHHELDESKKTVNDLILLRQSAFRNDQEKMDECRDKAIDAINNLFNDELPPEEGHT